MRIESKPKVTFAMDCNTMNNSEWACQVAMSTFGLMIVDVIIPAFNEEKSIALVLMEIDRSIVRNVFVVDNNSTDQTAGNAALAGGIVIKEYTQGYGAACLKGIAEAMAKSPQADIIVFMDADHSDYPEELKDVIAPILANKADMVIGSRALGKKENGSMTRPQVFGNWLATHMIRWLYGYKFTDLGPFRAITFKALTELKMKDTNYGWTVEMQVKAAKKKLRCAEVPVNYRNRIGKSKVSGTVKGTIMAGYKIITTIVKLNFE